ncbi:MAG: hypothetical protein GY866_21410 [Proteobacteria bacterium]|nr:hypothetical protein [Pseudomonadota bacterium]
MAEEDLDLGDDDLDLGDDDLNLGDDSGDDLDLGDDSGDDFAGDLDEMMGDDELGGDSGGESETDSELDSFFEDLSSIEDMDEGAPETAEEEPEAEEEAPAPTEKKEAPVKKKKASAPEKEKGSMLKFVVLGLVLLIAGAGGVGAFLFFRGEPQIVKEEMPPQEIPMPAEAPIRIEQKPVPRATPEPDLPPPPVKIKPERKYLIQVATCSYKVCKEDFVDSLRQDGEPVFQKSASEKYDFIQLISRQVYSYNDANAIARRINRKNERAGNAFILDQSNGYRISMGTFPALDRAKEIKFHVEKMFPQNGVAFDLEHVRKDYATTKIYAGPYDSRVEAKTVLKELRLKKKYKGAFLVSF